MNNYNKYIKYKTKYEKLKSLLGGNPNNHLSGASALTYLSNSDGNRIILVTTNSYYNQNNECNTSDLTEHTHINLVSYIKNTLDTLPALNIFVSNDLPNLQLLYSNTINKHIKSLSQSDFNSYSISTRDNLTTTEKLLNLCLKYFHRDITNKKINFISTNNLIIDEDKVSSYHEILSLEHKYIEDRLRNKDTAVSQKYEYLGESNIQEGGSPEPLIKVKTASSETSKPPITKPPVINLSSTTPPVVNLPSTKPPATKPPVVNPSATKPPVVNPSATKPPAAFIPGIVLPLQQEYDKPLNIPTPFVFFSLYLNRYILELDSLYADLQHINSNKTNEELLNTYKSKSYLHKHLIEILLNSTLKSKKIKIEIEPGRFEDSTLFEHILNTISIFITQYKQYKIESGLFDNLAEAMKKQNDKKSIEKMVNKCIIINKKLRLCVTIAQYLTKTNIHPSIILLDENSINGYIDPILTKELTFLLVQFLGFRVYNRNNNGINYIYPFKNSIGLCLRNIVLFNEFFTAKTKENLDDLFRVALLAEYKLIPRGRPLTRSGSPSRADSLSRSGCPPCDIGRAGSPPPRGRSPPRTGSSRSGSPPRTGSSRSGSPPPRGRSPPRIGPSGRSGSPIRHESPTPKLKFPPRSGSLTRPPRS